MSLLLTLLLLASLVAPPVLSQNYQTFLKKHTFEKNRFVDCNCDMNKILQSLKKNQCKPCNSFILGDQSYATNIDAVTKVCTSGGINQGRSPQGGTYFKSKKSFRVVNCLEMTKGRKPPNCDYKKVKPENIRSKKIILTCENDLPVHFNPC